MWHQRPLCGSPGMVGVTVVCGPRNPCAAVLRWWELICGVWPQIPTCGSPGMVGVTVVCGLRYPRVTVLGWWELLWCVASDTQA